MANDKVYYATGRRKTSTARVFLKPGKGKFSVNSQALAEYAKRKTAQMVMLQALETIGAANKFDVNCTVVGGGEFSQAGAVRHGIARALIAFDPEYRAQLKKEGLLTRDPRMKERKKPGLHGARRRAQYSKR